MKTTTLSVLIIMCVACLFGGIAHAATPVKTDTKTAVVVSDEQKKNLDELKTDSKNWFTKHIYTPVDQWRTNQVIIWRAMVAEDTNQMTAGNDTPKNSDAGASLDTKINSDELINMLHNSKEINQVVDDFDPEQMLGAAYRIFLQFLIFIFNMPILFYGLGGFLAVGLIVRFIKLFVGSGESA